MSPPAGWPSYVAVAIVALAGVRAVSLSALWLYGAAAVQRFHVETGWVWFAAAALSRPC